MPLKKAINAANLVLNIPTVCNNCKCNNYILINVLVEKGAIIRMCLFKALRDSKETLPSKFLMF